VCRGRRGSAAFPVAPIAVALLGDALAFRPAIGRERAADIRLFFREVTRSVAPNVAFVTFVRLSELTWHRKILPRVRCRDNSVSAVAVPAFGVSSNGRA